MQIVDKPSILRYTERSSVRHSTDTEKTSLMKGHTMKEAAYLTLDLIKSGSLTHVNPYTLADNGIYDLIDTGLITACHISKGKHAGSVKVYITEFGKTFKKIEITPCAVSLDNGGAFRTFPHHISAITWLSNTRIWNYQRKDTYYGY